MSLNILEQKNWVIGHKITDIKVTGEELRIEMDDGKTIVISLIAHASTPISSGIRAILDPHFEVDLVAQVTIPGQPAIDDDEERYHIV